MDNASFTITGNKLIEGITKILINRSQEGTSSYHHFETGSTFVFHELGISEQSYSIVVVVDQCNFNVQDKSLKVVFSIIGNKGVLDWNYSKRKNKRFTEFHQEIGRFCKGYNWSLGELKVEV